jgi:hypothetical protein
METLRTHDDVIRSKDFVGALSLILLQGLPHSHG